MQVEDALVCAVLALFLALLALLLCWLTLVLAPDIIDRARELVL